MGTEAHRQYDRTDVYQDLHGELAVHRHAAHAREMASALLRAERDGPQLVGLVDECQRAVYYSPTARMVSAVPFDKHGVYETRSRPLCRDVGDAQSWVRSGRTKDLDWAHPFFR